MSKGKVFIPMTFKKRGGKKIIIHPDKARHECDPRDPALLLALTRAHLWQRQLDSGKYSNTSDLARANFLDRGYVCKILSINFLAPRLKEAILKGIQSEKLMLNALKAKSFPVLWKDQEDKFSHP